MFETLIILTALVIWIFAIRAYQDSRDPLCPAIIFAPLLTYVYAYHPYSLLKSGQLFQYYPTTSRLEYVQLVTLLGVGAFCVGCQWCRPPQAAVKRFGDRLGMYFTPRMRRRARQSGWLLAVVAIIVMSSMIWASGPRIFRTAKPFFSSPISSGYYRELINLAFPAALLIALGWAGTRLSIQKVLALLIALSPMIFMATVGGRRGPMFHSICTMAACVFIIRQKRPKLSLVMGGLAMVGVLLLFLQVNRSRIFRPWEEKPDVSVVANALAGNNLTPGDEFLVSSATILAATRENQNFWGLRYFGLFFVRMIPRQIWPTKYSDLGLGWLESAPGSNGISRVEWLRIVGYIPTDGSAGGFVSDLYLEFHFAAIIGTFLIGYVYSRAWKRSYSGGALWSIIYFEMLILSVYLPSQSVGAWLYRLMLLAVPTWFVWAKIIDPAMRTRRPSRRWPSRPPQQPGRPSLPDPIPAELTLPEAEAAPV